MSRSFVAEMMNLRLEQLLLSASLPVPRCEVSATLLARQSIRFDVSKSVTHMMSRSLPQPIQMSPLPLINWKIGSRSRVMKVDLSPQDQAQQSLSRGTIDKLS